jgi:serine-type D-Ala-D-Ala carboxypeptidase (penicillin-binding protein 5/6)
VKRIAVLFCLVATCYAAGSATASPPSVDADAWVVENDAGQLLGASNPNEEHAIASITKLMTVLVVLDHHKLSDLVTVDARSSAVGQESIDLRPGEQLTVADLIEGALIQSANDAAVALALATSPDLFGFANLMNAKAEELGLVHTHFVNPDGLDAPGAYSTAADVTTLARDAMRVPFIRTSVHQSAVVIGGGRTLHTWNDLLGIVPGVIGVKTGHTNDAGWSQVVADEAGTMTIYVTILGSPSRATRNADLESLISWGIGLYSLVVAITAKHPYAQVALPYGRKPLALVAKSELRASVRPGGALTERVVAARYASLPVRRGEVLGNVQIWAGGKLVGRRPLIASRSVAAPGVGGRVGWYARRTVHDVVGWFT